MNLQELHEDRDFKLSVAICNYNQNITVNVFPERGKIVVFDSETRFPLASYDHGRGLLHGLISNKKNWGLKILPTIKYNSYVYLGTDRNTQTWREDLIKHGVFDKERFDHFFKSEFYEYPVQSYPVWKNPPHSHIEPSCPTRSEIQ